MALFTEKEKRNISYKSVFGIQGTWNGDPPDGFHWSQEEFTQQQWILNNEVIMGEIPLATDYAAAQAAATDTVTLTVKRQHYPRPETQVHWLSNLRPG